MGVRYEILDYLQIRLQPSVLRPVCNMRGNLGASRAGHNANVCYHSDTLHKLARSLLSAHEKKTSSNSGRELRDEELLSGM